MPRFGAAPLFTAVLFGICVGFLPHNFHPARIFMGDSGSMLIGLLASRIDDQPYRPGRRRCARLAQPLTGAAAVGSALRCDRGPRRRPAARGRAQDPSRALAVLPGQAAPASQAAGDRPFAPPSRAHHVLLGGPRRLRSGGGVPRSLPRLAARPDRRLGRHRHPAAAVAAACQVVATHVCHRRRAEGHRCRGQSQGRGLSAQPARTPPRRRGARRCPTAPPQPCLRAVLVSPEIRQACRRTGRLRRFLALRNPHPPRRSR